MTLPVAILTAAEAYQTIRAMGREMQGRCLQLQAQFTAGTLYAAFLTDVLNAAVGTVSEIAALRTVPGLANYARSQLGDDTLDLTPALTASLTALHILAATIRAEYPRNADGFLLDRTFGPDGSV